MRPYLLLCLFFLFALKDINSQELIRQGTISELPTYNLRDGINFFGFQPNMGQVGNFENQKVKDVLFTTIHNGIELYFRNDGVSYVIREIKQLKTDRFEKGFERENLFSKEVEKHWARIDLNLINGDINPGRIEYEEQLPGYSNYYLSHCPEGVLFVPSYRVVRIKEVYPGIDWIWKIGEDGLLHHEFEVKEGANIENIKLEFKWADVELSEDKKSLRLKTPVGVIEDGKIIGYDVDGKIDLRYSVDDGRFISFRAGENYQGKLTIDPPLARLWATYYGGSDWDEGNSIFTDGSGNIFLTGKTQSTNFPTYNPGGSVYYQGIKAQYSDVFILKFTNSGILLWATYYGGSDWDYGRSITADGFGNIFLTGRTWSSDFPIQDPGGGAYYQAIYDGSGYSDAFILKLTNNGVRLWATYYGGNNNDEGISIITDGSGNLFLTGYTESTNFPTYNPGGGVFYQGSLDNNLDIFILKFSNSGIRQWATYYGGSGLDFGRSITTDGSGNIFITGWTDSPNFPIQNSGGGAYYQGTLAGTYDVFILKFNNSGARLWATYYGGNFDDKGISISTDGSGNIFLTGSTWSTNFPTYNPGGGAYYQGSLANWPDAFILKFTNSGMRVWATYYGGNSSDVGNSITIDPQGNVFVAGFTESQDFATQNPGGGAYYQGMLAGSVYSDVFILEFTNSGVRNWATYYGGSDYDEGVSITTDSQGNIFLTGKTWSVDYPVQNPGGGAYYQGAIAGNDDVFILKFQGSGATGVEDKMKEIPKVFTLYQNYPNPFNPSTKISFTLSENGMTALKIYNSLGQEIKTLLNSELEAGKIYNVDFEASGLPSGIYYAQLVQSNKSKIVKMVLVK